MFLYCTRAKGEQAPSHEVKKAWSGYTYLDMVQSRDKNTHVTRVWRHILNENHVRKTGPLIFFLVERLGVVCA